MTAEIQRDLGKHDAQIDALERELREIKNDQRRIFEKLDCISQTLSEAKGGWKLFMIVGGASAAFGAFLVKISAMWWGR
jgi:putative NADH-flavin reductase